MVKSQALAPTWARTCDALQTIRSEVSKIESIIDDEPESRRLLLLDKVGTPMLTIRSSSAIIEAWKKVA